MEKVGCWEGGGLIGGGNEDGLLEGWRMDLACDDEGCHFILYCTCFLRLLQRGSNYFM